MLADEVSRIVRAEDCRCRRVAGGRESGIAVGEGMEGVSDSHGGVWRM